MKADRTFEIERAFDANGETRLILLHGPDRAGSEVLAARLAAAMGEGVERIDLTGSELKSDPARLADEAAAISMFGDKRLIRVDPAGDECLPAFEALLGAGAAGNPVVALAGQLRATGKLLKLAHASPAVIAVASYPPEGRDADRLALALAQAAGLRVAPDVAHRLAEASADRALLAAEIDKLALFADAAPDRPREATHAMLDALSADTGAGDMGEAVNRALDGDAAGLDAELARLAGVGIEGVPVIRALLRRLGLLARLRAQVERGDSAQSVVARAGHAVFWKEKDRTIRQLQLWSADMLARAIERALAAERALKRSGGPGTVVADDELFALARVAGRRR